MTCATLALLGLLALATSTPPAAPPDPTSVWDQFPDDDLLVLQDELVVEIAPDGSTRTSSHVEIRALTDRGRELLQSKEFYFNRAVEELVIDRACSIDNRGYEHCADASRIIYEPEAGETIIPGQNEPIHVVVPFEEVRVGSTTILDCHWQTGPNEGGRFFEAIGVFHSQGPMLSRKVYVLHPASRPIYGTLIGEGQYERSERDGMVAQRWTFGPQPAPSKDSNKPSKLELYPNLYLTEFAGWAEFLAWYQPYLETARENFAGAGAREVTALQEPAFGRLDPVIRLGFIFEDRTPNSTVDLSLGTLLPGPMETVVSQAGTQLERALALLVLLDKEGVEGAYLAFASRGRLNVPAELASPMPYGDAGVYVEGRGFIDPDAWADWVDTVPSVRRGGTMVILDPESPRVLRGEELDLPEDRPAWHREGRLTLSGDELRVHETLTFSGSAETATRSAVRSLQDDLEDEEKLDRKMKAAYARALRQAPEKSYRELAVRAFAIQRGYAQGNVREATFFEPMDPGAEVAVELRYVPEGSVEQVAQLLLVRLPLKVETVSGKCAKAPPDRETPLKISCWTYTYRYEFPIPDKHELVGLPPDQDLTTEFADLKLHFAEAMVPAEAGGDGEDGKAAKEGDGEAPEPVPGVIIEASYIIHKTRISVLEYRDFLEVAGRHALSFTDPIVLRKVAGGGP